MALGSLRNWGENTRYASLTMKPRLEDGFETRMRMKRVSGKSSGVFSVGNTGPGVFVERCSVMGKFKQFDLPIVVLYIGAGQLKVETAN